MRYLRLLAAMIFVVVVPVFLITSNVRWVINAPLLYSYGFDKYDIPSATGIELSELLSAGRQIRDYFNNDQAYLDLRVTVNGTRVSLYNEREVLHMKDVKGLVQDVYRVQQLSGAYLATFAILILAVRRSRFLRIIGWHVGLGGVVTLGLASLVGMMSLVGFDRLFLVFHMVSFSNDLWQLDPSRDYLIAMFPEGFFFDATMVIALSTVLEALVLAIVPLYHLRRRAKSFHKYVSSERTLL